MRPKTRTKSALPIIIKGTIGRRIGGSCPRITATSGETEPRITPARGFRASVVRISIRLTSGPVIGCGRPSISKDSVSEIKRISRVIKFVLLIINGVVPVLFKKESGIYFVENKVNYKKGFLQYRIQVSQLWMVKIANRDYNKEWSDNKKSKSLRRMPESPKNNGLEIPAYAGMTRSGNFLRSWIFLPPVSDVLRIQT